MAHVQYFRNYIVSWATLEDLQAVFQSSWTQTCSTRDPTKGRTDSRWWSPLTNCSRCSNSFRSTGSILWPVIASRWTGVCRTSARRGKSDVARFLRKKLYSHAFVPDLFLKQAVPVCWKSFMYSHPAAAHYVTSVIDIHVYQPDIKLFPKLVIGLFMYPFINPATHSLLCTFINLIINQFICLLTHLKAYEKDNINLITTTAKW